MASLLIQNIGLLVQAEKRPRQVVKGAEMRQLPTIPNAFLLVENDRIAAFGPMERRPERADTVIDASGRLVLPSWCDAHTHLVFPAPRDEEFVDRIRGLSYEEIARRGGGILHSAHQMRQMTEETLLESTWQRLCEVMSQGTGAIEIKSGYGLTLEGELKMLRVIRRLKALSPIPIKATFLGAHALPEEYRTRRGDYVDLVIHQMLPRIAEEGLADYCDVFCDRGFFTPQETERILKAAWRYGLKPKIHANELANSGGVQVGVAQGAVSVDHLECIGAEEIALLRASLTIPTLLPACAFFLGIPYAPARQLIDAGLPVALASDYNPGSAPSGRMAFVVSLACIQMKMLPEEAINAATLNGARAMELEAEYGSIAVGKKANLFITRPMTTPAQLPYFFGTDPVETVILNGQIWRQSPVQGVSIKKDVPACK